MVVLQDALAATGPYLQQCLGVGYALSDRGPAGLACVPVRRGIGAGAAGEWFADDSEETQACDRQLRLVSDVPLDHTHPGTRYT